MQKFLDLWKKWSMEGVHLPFIKDPETNKPSVTLLFPYITFFISVVSVITLHFTDVLVASLTCIFFWAASVIFYRLRKLDKAKIDLDDKQIELEGSDSNET